MSRRRDALEWIDHELDVLRRRGLLRALATHSGPQQVRLPFGDRELINFGSNDYLGLAADHRLAAAAKAGLDEGTGAGASPLIAGHSAAHQRLEEQLAQFEGTEAALVFSSGYAANLGTIAALVGRGDAIYADAKNHASLIDGCRLSRADVHVYPHNEAQALAAQLAQSGAYQRRLIVTESVFSMDGDLAPLTELAELAERFDCMLLVDEAHATGVFGAGGRGLGEELGVAECINVRIGTLSKALGCSGGFVAGSRRLVEWLVNRARTYVFSTGLPPATCAAASVALEIVRDEPQRRERLLHTAAELRKRLRAQGWTTLNSGSQIIPLVIGEPTRARRLSRQLRAAGIFVPAIRPPSVPEGESLLRISLTCEHSQGMVDELVCALESVKGELAAASAGA